MPKVWRFLPHDESCVRKLCAGLRISPLTAQVLAARGYVDCDQAERFLSARLTDLHEPDLLFGVPEAAERILAAMRAGRRITVYGDYDVDGVTGTSILWQCLKLAGAPQVDYYIPCRLQEGYGLNAEALRSLSAEDPHRLVVTVDCGIGSIYEAAVARELGLELVVTDHHAIGATLPDAACVVHPRLPGGEYPFGELCGAGVAFKLAWAICQRLGDGKRASARMREFLKSAVVLTAIGTVADVVPLVGENRVIVRYGLSSLHECASPGLKALIQSAGLEGEIDADGVGFSLAPRINAAGRLGQARLAVELLTTADESRAAALAAYLGELNDNRKSVERKMFRQAKELVEANPRWVEDGALVLAHAGWHPGVIGIVAARVAEHYERPAILIALDGATNSGQGSGRSFGGFDLYGGLARCAQHLRSFGGHQAAAGLKIEAECIDAFREEFCRLAAGTCAAAHEGRELSIDAEVRLADVTCGAVKELHRLGPFGHQNRRPVFAATGVDLVEPPRKMGDGERHLSLRVRQFGTVLRAVAFGRAEWADEIVAAGGRLAVSFAPSINRYRGLESVELQLVDWQAEHATGARVKVPQHTTLR